MTPEYVTPQGSLCPIARRPVDPVEASDLWALLALFVDSYMHAAERAANSTQWYGFIERCFLMLHGHDRDAHDPDHSDLDHLTDEVPRPEERRNSRDEPVVVAALARVLEGRAALDAVDLRTGQRAVNSFGAAPVRGLGDLVVNDIVVRTFRHNSGQDLRGSRWRVSGLEVVDRPAREVSLNRVAEPVELPISIAPADDFDPAGAGPLHGTYARGREEADRILFGDDRPNPQVVPRMLGLLLCVTYTMEYMTSGDHPEDRPAGHLRDDRRHSRWTRVAIPASKVVDPANDDESHAKFCARTAERFPWLVEILDGGGHM